MKAVLSFSPFLLFALCDAFPAPLFAQNPLGGVGGTIQDSTGARIAGASISVSNAEKSLTRDAQSDAQGEFRVEDLLPGAYQLTASVGGFAAARAKVIVAVSSVREITITLRPKSVSEKVVVDGDDSVTIGKLETGSATQQAVIYRRDLETIPLAAHSFANIAYLAPGTEPVEPSDPTKARITAVDRKYWQSCVPQAESFPDHGGKSQLVVLHFLFPIYLWLPNRRHPPQPFH